MSTDRNREQDKNTEARDLSDEYDEAAIFGMELPDYDVVSGEVAEYTYEARNPMESIVPDGDDTDEPQDPDAIPEHDRLVVLSYLALGYDAQNIAYAARMDEDYVREILDDLDLDGE